jgi:hypothetical protein
MGGEVTKISHQYGVPLTKYPKGDQQFDVGTVMAGVSQGWPMKVQGADLNTFITVFGKPDRTQEDGYHAYLALNSYLNTLGHFVRVVDDTAKYQYLSLYSDWLVDKTATEWAAETTFDDLDITHKGDVFYVSQQDANTGNDPATDDGTWWVAYIKPGSATFATTVTPSGNVMMIAILKNGVVAADKYGFKISGINATKETFVVTVYKKLADNTDQQVGDPLTVSLDQDALAADGSSLFIESVFEQKSNDIQFKVIASPTFAKILEHGTVWFTGGAAGGTPTATNYETAWNLLKDTTIDLDQLFMAGDSDADHVADAVAVANERNVRIECDYPAGNTVAQNVTYLAGLSLTGEKNVSFTHGRISCNDMFYTGNRKYLSISGLATGAKGWSRETSKTLVDPAVWEAPAGEGFGALRGITGVKNETPITEPDKVTLTGVWSNYIVNSSDKGIIVWEQYTMFGEESHYAYKDQMDIINYVYKIHRLQMQSQLFRMKTDQQIIDSLSGVLSRLKTKGVLIASTAEGVEIPEPYRIWITTEGTKRWIHRALRPQRAIGAVILETVPM